MSTNYLDMTIRKLRDGIFVDTDGMNGGNHGAIVLDNEVLMIDSGMIHTTSRTTKDIIESEIGLPIKKLVFTHSHSDHVYGAQAFEPVLLISSELMYKQIELNLKNDWSYKNIIKRYSSVKEERPELWSALQTISIRLPDIVFDQEITIGDEIQATARLMGGHTSGSSIVFSKEYNTAFIGDLVFYNQFPYGGDSTCDLDRWILALEEIHVSEYETIIPGHGQVFNQSGLEEYNEALIELRESIKDAINTGLSVESFIKREMIPTTLQSGFERFGEITLRHWFRFYS